MKAQLIPGMLVFLDLCMWVAEGGKMSIIFLYFELAIFTFDNDACLSLALLFVLCKHE